MKFDGLQPKNVPGGCNRRKLGLFERPTHLTTFTQARCSAVFRAGHSSCGFERSRPLSLPHQSLKGRAVRPTDRKAPTIAQFDGPVIASPRRQAGDLIAADDRGAMDSNEMRGIEPGLQGAEGVVNQVGAPAAAQADVVALGFRDVDGVQGQSDHLASMPHPEIAVSSRSGKSDAAMINCVRASRYAPKKLVGSPFDATSTAKTPPASGWLASVPGSRPIEIDVTNRVLRSGPPNATLVGFSTGTDIV